jgi:8-oxo-dGTP diphosphatase
MYDSGMPKETTLPTLVGVELFARRAGGILLGKRKNCAGAGTWALPGGHLEFNERLVDTMCREAAEELGVIIEPEELRLVSVVDDLQPENNLHYVHVSFEQENPAWEPRIMEPERCAEWRYFPLSGLPERFFEPHRAIVANYLRDCLYSI